MTDPHLTNYKWIFLDEIESTNNYAMGLIHEGMAEDKTLILTLNQTAGKGQRSKTWTTEPGTAITLSLLTKPPLPHLHDKFLLSAAMAVGVLDFFKEIAGDESSIKWPNDIYWRDRKAAGILIENNLNNHEWKWAVIGIGLNVNQTQFPKELPNPVSLKQITGQTFDIIEEAGNLMHCLDAQLSKLEKKDHQQILAAYNNSLYKRNKACRFRKENIVFESMVEHVSPDGRLHLSNELSYDFGELEWLI